MKINWHPSWKQFGINPNYRGRFAGKIDLHIHSDPAATVKDLTVGKICQFASYYGLSAIAITDHENIERTGSLLTTSRQFGQPVISGVEINAQLPSGHNLDILGYGFKVDHLSLQLFIKNIWDDEAAATKQMIGWVNGASRPALLAKAKGVEALPDSKNIIDPAEEEKIVATVSARKTIGRKIIADLLINKGFFRQQNDGYYPNKPAFTFLGEANRLFGRQHPAVATVIDIIHQAGGLTFMAHPFGTFNNCALAMAKQTGQDPQLLIPRLLGEYPFDGVEVVHSDHSDANQTFLLKIAKQQALLVSGGSDTHWKLNEANHWLGITPAKALTMQEWIKDKIA